ncbi:hypothetical protein EI555_008092, partial [Monodon monoceros]
VDLHGRDLDQLLDMSYRQPMVAAAWNLQGRQHFLPTGLHKAPAEKPEVVKVHLQGVIILCEAVGGTRETFNQLEIKPEMFHCYLSEYSITYRPMDHSWLDIRVTHSFPFIPFK